MNIIASKKGSHVVFIDTTFSKAGFANGTKIGALEFDPKKFVSVDKAVEAAKQLKWKLVERVDSDLCDVVAL